MSGDIIKDLSVETALGLINEIENEDDRKLAIKSIASYLAMAGKYDRALKLCNNIPEIIDDIIEDISYDYEEYAEKIFNKEPLKYIRKIVYSGLSKDKKLDLIRNSLKIAKDGYDYCDIAKAFAKLGAKDEALNALNKALNLLKADEQVDCLRRVAYELYKAGFVNEALDLFEQAFNLALQLEKRSDGSNFLELLLESIFEDVDVVSCDNRDDALKLLAYSVARCGEFNLALKVTENIEDDLNRGHALKVIIEFIYKQDICDQSLISKVFKIAQALNDFSKCVIVSYLAWIAREGLISGHVEDLLSRLIKLTETIRGMWKSIALFELAITYAMLNDLDKALKLAEVCLDNDLRSKAIVYIACRLAEIGYRSRAEELIGYVNEPDKVFYYLSIDRIDKAKIIVDTYLNSWDLSELKEILLGLIYSKRSEDFVDVIKKLRKKLKDEDFWVVLTSHSRYESLIFRVVCSDLNESDKIELLNELYSIAKTLHSNDIDYRSDILRELAESIAWWSLRKDIIKRAKRLEKRGFIEKALELYRFAEAVEDFEKFSKDCQSSY